MRQQQQPARARPDDDVAACIPSFRRRREKLFDRNIKSYADLPQGTD
jgi:hypothetical protein